MIPTFTQIQVTVTRLIEVWKLTNLCTELSHHLETLQAIALKEQLPEVVDQTASSFFSRELLV